MIPVGQANGQRTRQMPSRRPPRYISCFVANAARIRETPHITGCRVSLLLICSWASVELSSIPLQWLGFFPMEFLVVGAFNMAMMRRRH